ncbi:histone-lysine N-trimethyltransferase SMYD5-like isoform X2 [Littorina saxatilis]|uniref:histone-lysine N-trimethyltransferase SMYD5-like isoform X2 n=1 Tax=Littorina saxatilis TaxID=31220 RepID=UPI0038B534C7
MATSAGSGVEVRSLEAKKGKGLYAKTHFKKEETILTEAPLVCAQFSWNELYKYEACEFCLRSLETAEEMSRRLTNNPSLVLPHPECCEVDSSVHTCCPHCQVKYCREACRVAAWDRYHRVLCMGASRDDSKHPLAMLQEAWRNIHYPPETASIMLLAKMVAMVRQTQLELLQGLAREALYHDDVQQWFTPEGFRSIFALIGTNGQGIGSSSISTWVKNCEKLSQGEKEKEEMDKFIDEMYEELDKEAGAFLNCDGSGLFELQSTCNHSCTPNAEINFLHGDHTLTLMALKDIEPDEEICISYLDECSLERSRHSRQNILRENYLFNCSCQLCLEQADEPDETSEEEMSEGDEEDEEEG